MVRGTYWEAKVAGGVSGREGGIKERIKGQEGVDPVAVSFTGP